MARPRLGDSESKRLQMVITEDELHAIDEWQHVNRVSSRSEAIRRLCQIGLRVDQGYVPIGRAARALASAGDALVKKFYLLPDRAPHLSDEEKLALKAYRLIMRRTSLLIDALASVELQREELADAARSIEDALSAADEARRLYSDAPPP